MLLWFRQSAELPKDRIGLPGEQGLVVRRLGKRGLEGIGGSPTGVEAMTEVAAHNEGESSIVSAIRHRR
jgi:hypothetical protein